MPLYLFIRRLIEKFFNFLETTSTHHRPTSNINLNLSIEIRHTAEEKRKDYVGTVKLFAGFLPPDGWMICDGRILKVRDYVDLFTVIGNTYGGNGRTTFALPDMRGRVPVGTGTGENLKHRSLGEKFGSETISIKVNQIPIVTTDDLGNVLTNYSEPDSQVNEELKSRVVTSSMKGRRNVSIESKPIDSSQPSLCMNYIICYNGEYPEEV